MKFFTLCVDLEKFDLLNKFGIRLSEEASYEISLRGLVSLRSVLNEFNIKATFFVTEEIAMIFPEKIKLLAIDGHEIALHSVLWDYEREQRLERLKRQKLIVENVIGSKIFGHQSHKFIPISLNELKEVGFLYDNSLHPTYVPGRYCNIFSRRELYKEHNMIEVPVTVTPLFRLPFSCFWFRVFGVSYAKLCSKFTYLTQEFINIYFHTWDFGDITDNSLRWPYRLLLRNLGNKTISNFKCFLDWLRKENISVVTMSEYLHNQLAERADDKIV